MVAKQVACCNFEELEDMGLVPIEYNQSEVLEYLISLSNSEDGNNVNTYRAVGKRYSYCELVDNKEYCVYSDIKGNCRLYEMIA